MKYYKLDKKEYKKYEKEFKKTYIGKDLFNKQIIDCCVAIPFYTLAAFHSGYNSIDSLQISFNDFVLLFLGLACLLEALVWNVQFRKELKNYILESIK